MQELARAKRAYEARNYIETIIICDAALAVDDAAVAFMKLRARALEAAGRLTESAEAYERMEGLVHPLPIPLLNAGAVRLQAGHWELAARHFVRCVEWSLENSDTYAIGQASLLAGYALVKCGDRSAAIRMLQLCEHPAEMRVIWSLGQISRARVLADALAIPIH